MPKPSTYMDRAMQHRDPRFANVLGKLGYTTTDMAKAKAEPTARSRPGEDMVELEAMRAAYKEATGKTAHHKWKAHTIKNKLEEMDDPEPEPTVIDHEGEGEES